MFLLGVTRDGEKGVRKKKDPETQGTHIQCTYIYVDIYTLIQ